MTSVQLDGVKAVLEWGPNDKPQYLTEPDPNTHPIQFTLRFDTTSALFQILIPISYKQHTKTSAIYVRIDPRSIISLKHSVERDLPDAIKPVFGSAISLKLELNDAVTILIPKFISEPVAAARQRSWTILHSLHELVQTTSLRIYIPDDVLSQNQLESLSTATAQQLDLFSGPEYDISRWFSGHGAKVTTLTKPSPPTYNTATAAQANVPLYGEIVTFNPSTTSRKRKGSWDEAPNKDVIWDRLLRLEAAFHDRSSSNVPGDHSQLVQELQGEIGKLQTQLTQCEKKILDGATEIDKLQTQLTQCEKNGLDLETEIAGLRDAQDNAENKESVEIIEIHDTLQELQGEIEFVKRGKDDDELARTIKVSIWEDIIARFSGD